MNRAAPRAALVNAVMARALDGAYDVRDLIGLLRKRSTHTE